MKTLAATFAIAAVAFAASPVRAQNDPFEMPVRKTAPKQKPATATSFDIPAPPFAERAATCQKNATGLNSVEGGPCPYLVSELKVVGVFSSADGIGAFVQAKPTGQTFVVKENDALFDGKVAAIRPDSATANAAVVFVQKRRVQTKNVVKTLETKVELGVESGAGD